MNKSESSTGEGTHPVRSVICEPGKIYRLRYRLTNQQKDRYGQLKFLQYQTGTTLWSGRPTVGNVVLRDHEILEVSPLPVGEVAVTFHDKREVPWTWTQGGPTTAGRRA